MGIQMGSELFIFIFFLISIKLMVLMYCTLLEFIRSINATVEKVMYPYKDSNHMQMVCMLALRWHG